MLTVPLPPLKTHPFEPEPGYRQVPASECFSATYYSCFAILTNSLPGNGPSAAPRDSRFKVNQANLSHKISRICMKKI